MTHARLGIARTMFALCAMAGALAACQPKPPTAAGLPGVAQTPPEPRRPVVWTRDVGSPAEFRAAQAGIARLLRNPDGTQYRGLYALRSDTGLSMICGEINPRNPAGQSVGFFHFAYISPGIFIPSNDPRFAAQFPTICQPRTMTPSATAAPTLPTAP